LESIWQERELALGYAHTAPPGSMRPAIDSQSVTVGQPARAETLCDVDWRGHLHRTRPQIAHEVVPIAFRTMAA
jgi:hypothetical protein